MRYLLCGHRSFAARGLAEALESAGHQVVRFSRGPAGAAGSFVGGPVEQLHENPGLQGRFDAVVNYIVLKDETVDSNARYAEALLRLCAARSVPHLVHISSISVYGPEAIEVREDSPAETDPARKGAYGALKVAAERVLVDHRPASLALSLVRPGFVLGEGLANPIVGTGMKLPWNRLLALGNASSALPVVSRDLLNAALVRILASAPAPGVESYLLAHPGSPTRREYLQACCERLGGGTGVTSMPVPLWLLAGAAGEIAARLTGRGEARVFMKVRSLCRRQSFRPARTESRLGLSLAFDWRDALQRALPSQEPGVRLPYAPPVEVPPTSARRVVFLGYGRIVRQRHRPALRRLGFDGAVVAHDVQPRRDEDGTEVTALPAALGPADLVVVASPGPAHTAALELLAGHQGGILVEKPLCSSLDELARWVRFAEGRRWPTLVCHNYRLKPNVRRVLDTLRHHHSGALLNVHVEFESPSVAGDAAPWRRQERQARTLLMDYGLHFLDLACMFETGRWEVSTTSHRLDGNGATAVIEGRLSGPSYTVSFVLRQGFGRRTARLAFTFQNYAVRLGFFPDTFTLRMADDNPVLDLQEAAASAAAVAVKVFDRLAGRESDPSHALAFAAALGEAPALVDALDVRTLRAFYDAVFHLGDAVYGRGPTSWS